MFRLISWSRSAGSVPVHGACGCRQTPAVTALSECAADPSPIHGSFFKLGPTRAPWSSGCCRGTGNDTHLVGGRRQRCVVVGEIWWETPPLTQSFHWCVVAWVARTANTAGPSSLNALVHCHVCGKVTPCPCSLPSLFKGHTMA